ncbi:MAG TPA: protein-methionine-sulfoxide reductase heme-binding subunit MsrQ [Vicinamibacterales bacterium]|nr:protein-methionine-sulfoxide reductase heme-binding subunit MsrQ [Vicinamibacterales bacterium]
MAAVARWFKPAVFLAAAVPGLWLARRAWTGGLGVDPVTTLMHTSGRDALLLLLATLAVTPIRRLTGWNRIQSVRRMLGLWTFFYALAHLSMYLVFNQLCYSLATCEFASIWDDVVKRKFIFAGMAAFAVLLALALTSTTGWIRRLGRNWVRLHRLIYLAGGAAIIHFVWKEKSDYSEPAKWGAALAVLLALRVLIAVRRRWAGRPAGGGAAS